MAEKEKIKKTTNKKDTVKKETAPKKKTTKKVSAEINKPKVEKEKINKEEPKKTEIKKETKAEEKQRLENIKAYKILSYIGILWLIGLLVPENEDKKLKFHVGQGIILSIFQLLLSFFVRIVNTMFVGMIFREEVYYYTQPTGIYTISFFGSVIMAILNLSMVVIIIYLMVIGISNAINDRQKELPIIGKYSFYK